jgi:hypothetical protein
MMAPLHPYPRHILELLGRQPAPGAGHRWLFRVAVNLRHYHDAGACYELLRRCCNTWTRRAVPDEEIRKTVRKAYACSDEAPAERSNLDWPTVDHAKVALVLAKTPTPEWFRANETAGTAWEVLPTLFNPDELVCYGLAQNHAEVTTLQELLGLNPAAFQFIVPSPMRAKLGETQDGRTSKRCLANTGPRRFLVVEFDYLPKDSQAKILLHLGQLLHLRLVIDSAGKSLHGWYTCSLTDYPVADTTLALWFDQACKLGADAHTWTRCQWVRMPGGTRPTEHGPQTQRILYWSPNA